MSKTEREVVFTMARDDGTRTADIVRTEILSAAGMEAGRAVMACADQNVRVANLVDQAMREIVSAMGAKDLGLLARAMLDDEHWRGKVLDVLVSYLLPVERPGQKVGPGSGHGPEWQRQRRLLERAARAWPELFLELGTQAQNVLADRYGVTQPATDGLRPPAQDMMVKGALSRVLWAYFITEGFTRDAETWGGKVPATPQPRTPSGAYVTQESRRLLVGQVWAADPDFIRGLPEECRLYLWQRYRVGDPMGDGTYGLKGDTFWLLLWHYFDTECLTKLPERVATTPAPHSNVPHPE